MKKNFLIALIAVCSFSYAAVAQEKVAVETNDKAGWHKITETIANLKSDRDEVMVMGADHYKAMKLKVTDAPVEITDLTVVFENEARQDIQVRKLIGAGEETRVIDLDGKDRAIKKIIIQYKTAPNAATDKAHVEIWGMK
jgi:hypothetical protein